MAAYFLSCRFTFPKQQMRRVLKAQGLAEGFDPNKRIKSCYHVTFKHRHIISATCKWVIHFGSFQCLPSVPEFSSTYYQSVPVFCVLHEDLLQRHCERKEHCLPPGCVSPGCWKEKKQMHRQHRSKQYWGITDQTSSKWQSISTYIRDRILYVIPSLQTLVPYAAGNRATVPWLCSPWITLTKDCMKDWGSNSLYSPFMLQQQCRRTTRYPNIRFTASWPMNRWCFTLEDP